MRPTREQDQPQRELFQVELEQIIDLDHPLVRLGMCIDWASFEEALGATYHPTQGAPGISTRLMVALHYLKYQHDLSDENVVAHWVENPYWQHFSGERYFQHRAPIDGSRHPDPRTSQALSAPAAITGRPAGRPRSANLNVCDRTVFVQLKTVSMACR